MDLIIGFAIFLIAMVISLTCNLSMILGLGVGLVAFTMVAIHRGFSFKEVSSMSFQGVKDSLIVIEVMAIIGLITAVWRASGTIAFFVNLGVETITPPLFLIITFLLSLLLSYALGTSFGVAATVGAIFMALARSAGVDELITAGVIMSGIYFGDRGAPVSSSAILVASCTGTKLMDNVKLMMKTSLIPLIITFGIYVVLSIANPMNTVDVSVLEALHKGFVLSWYEILPAVVMVVLPFLNVSISKSMGVSILTGGIIAMVIQKMDALELLKSMIMGYKVPGELGTIINGGGLISMAEVMGIIILSSTFSGIFDGTKMLSSILEKIEGLMMKLGRFPVCIGISIATIVVFCNQTIGTMMCKDLMLSPYENTGGSKEELAMDIENSVILIAGVIPWSLACVVPLGFMGVGYGAMKYAYFMYLVPICYGLLKKKWFNTERKMVNNNDGN